MKKLVVIIIFCLFMIKIIGQNVRYQGEVLAGYCFVGQKSLKPDRLNIQTIQGIKLGQYASLGVGFGFDFFYSKDIVLPLYLNTKAYIKVSDTNDLFLSIDFGKVLGITNMFYMLSAISFSTSIGTTFKLSNKENLALSLGYNSQWWNNENSKKNKNSIFLRAAFQFYWSED